MSQCFVAINNKMQISLVRVIIIWWLVLFSNRNFMMGHCYDLQGCCKQTSQPHIRFSILLIIFMVRDYLNILFNHKFMYPLYFMKILISHHTEGEREDCKLQEDHITYFYFSMVILPSEINVLNYQSFM